jgi:DNA mismatch repair ATPase MutS
MHQHDTQRCSFSFVSFIPSATPVINLTDCWTPLIKPEHAVSNTFTLGSNGTAIKGIITGPNGGGKSTILKSLGHALYLAHTFGIASAQESLISPFTSLRTCFHPQENLSEELSQFMAEKKCMDAVAQHVYDSRSTGFTCLLIDEPYRGTVNTETGERIYSFGSSVAPESHAVLLVATHVEKPIQLANDTQGLFDNYQVLIQERSPTTFKRTFKIAPGVAHWWFESADRRSRFIDWLCHDKNV